VEAVLALAAAAALIALAVGILRRSNSVWSDRLADLAAEHDGLEHIGARDDARLEGVVDGVRVGVDAYLALPGQLSSLTTRVRIETDLPGSLVVTREGVGAALAKLAGGEDLVIGDPGFDAAFRVRTGDPLSTVAHLDGRARDALRGLAERQEVRVEAGSVVVTSASYASPKELRAMLEGVVAVGRALGAEGSAVERLERIVHEDPVDGVRLRALDLLLGELSRARAEPIATRALNCDDPVVVARASAFLRGDSDSEGRLSIARVSAGDGRLSVAEGAEGAEGDHTTSDHDAGARAATVVDEPA